MKKEEERKECTECERSSRQPTPTTDRDNDCAPLVCLLVCKTATLRTLPRSLEHILVVRSGNTLIHLYLDRAWVLGLARLLVDTKIEGATPGKNLCKKDKKIQK